jgi:hypothetical protein
MNKPFEHIHYDIPISFSNGSETAIGKVAAKCIDMENVAVYNAVIEAAKKNGITDLYLLDEKFVLDALREKLQKESK